MQTQTVVRDVRTDAALFREQYNALIATANNTMMPVRVRQIAQAEADQMWESRPIALTAAIDRAMSAYVAECGSWSPADCIDETLDLTAIRFTWYAGPVTNILVRYDGSTVIYRARHHPTATGDTTMMLKAPFDLSPVQPRPKTYYRVHGSHGTRVISADCMCSAAELYTGRDMIPTFQTTHYGVPYHGYESATGQVSVGVEPMA